MKTLYISDLDGTLLNSDQRLSAESALCLKRAVENGARFTFATARTAASALKIMKEAPVNVPCILMNGVCIYDVQKQCYVRCEYIPEQSSKAIAELLDKLGQSGFMYRIENGKLSCSYTVLDSPALKEFYEMRKNRYDKPFTQIESFCSACDENVIYFALLDSYEKLNPVREAVEHLSGLRYEFYNDIYNKELWYLEIASVNASKREGVRFLRDCYGFERVIAFGDNLNDLPLFEAADLSYAVQNAVPNVKAQADRLTPYAEDGVAREIERLTVECEAVGGTQ